MAPLQNNGKLHGTIVYSVVGRLHYGFDVFTLHLPHAPSSLSQFKFLNHGRLTDGKSINYNAQFVAPSDAKLLLQGRALPPQNPMSQFDEEEELLVYVSERTGNARLHFSSASRKDGPVLGPPKGTVRVSEHPPFFFDRPVVRNGRAYFVSVQEPPDEPIKSWCAVYASCLKSGHTIRLTPRGVVDYSPALSPSGKWVMVASYGAGEWRRNHIHELQTGLYVFRAEDGSGRRMVTEQGGWPSWADENTVYFHRRAEDGWWSIYRLNLDRPVPPERITPPFVDAFTPCASATGNWIAVATRRPETEFRHIEIFDLQSKSFIPVTASISPQIHHYNPFVSPDSLRLGFHRFRGEDAEDADTVVPFLERVESPIQKLKLQRINGSFPAFSPDGTLIAFNPNIGLPDGGVHLVKADGSKKWEMNFKGPAFAVAWNGKQKGLLYASVGPIFASLQSTVHVVSLRFKPEDLGEESQVKSEVRVLTKEGTLNNAFSYSSPDGKELVFRSGRSGHKNLYIMDAEEGEEGWIRTLTKGPWIDTMPCWSPDGQWIAFSSNRHDPQQEEYFSVYLIHPDGTGLHRVPGPQKERINHVCFSPDSKSLLFTANFSGVSAEPVSLPNQFQPYGELFVAGLDGSNLQRLTFNAYEDGTPAWHQGCSDDLLNLNSLNLSGKEIAGEKLKGQFDEPLWLAKS